MPACSSRRRAAAREGHAVELEERDDVLVEGAVVLELVREVEDHVRLEALQLLAQQVEVVKNGDMPGRVPQTPQGGKDVRLRPPVFGL